MTADPINGTLPGPEREPAPVPAMHTAILASLAVAVAALLLFSWLANEVFAGHARRFDDFVRAWVHQYASPPLTTFMTAISLFGALGLAFVFAIALAIFLRLHWRRAAIWLAVTIAGGLVLEIALKNLYHRPRPEPFFGTLPHSYSFPSGHALMSFCLYGVLAGLLSRRLRSRALRIVVWIVAAVLIVTIGLSRIYLGVHYPTDVLAGYLAAAIWISALFAADRLRHRRRPSRLSS